MGQADTMDPGALLSRAPQRFAIESDGASPADGPRDADDDLLSPGAQFRFQCVAVHMPQDVCSVAAQGCCG